LAGTATLAPLAKVRVQVTRVKAAQGEDGHGNTVAAIRPAAIDLVTEGVWPGRALATTLAIGDQRFHNMGYPNVRTMRFLVADEEALPRGAEVALEVGSPSGPRRVLASTLPESP